MEPRWQKKSADGSYGHNCWTDSKDMVSYTGTLHTPNIQDTDCQEINRGPNNIWAIYYILLLFTLWDFGWKRTP